MKSMKKSRSNLYLYLARRDKTGVRIISTLSGTDQPAVRLKDLHVLQLPANIYNQVKKMIHDDRMYWEPWIESAPNYETLRDSLKKRGYSGLPMSGQPELLGEFFSNPQPAKQTNLPQAKTMIRKKA